MTGNIHPLSQIPLRGSRQPQSNVTDAGNRPWMSRPPRIPSEHISAPHGPGGLSRHKYSARIRKHASMFSLTRLQYFPPRGPSAIDQRPSRPYGLRSLTRPKEQESPQKGTFFSIKGYLHLNECIFHSDKETKCIYPNSPYKIFEASKM